MFGNRDFLPIAKRSVLLALITIVSGFLVIALEIENPIRMVIYLFASPNFSSNIWWMGTLYMLYMIFMAIEFVLLLRESHRVAAFFGFLTASSLPLLIISEVCFGASIGLIYYSSLYYSMNVSKGRSTNAGIHEAVIGVGLFMGPAIGALALYLSPAAASIGAWSVGGLLCTGFIGLFLIKKRN